MTDALRKMVEAMAAEIRRQVALGMDSGPGDYPGVEIEQGWLVVFENDGAFNLEKVARAGLGAIMAPGQDLLGVGYSALTGVSGLPEIDCTDLREGWQAMLAEILKEPQ